jgi:hypothetical protein
MGHYLTQNQIKMFAKELATQEAELAAPATAAGRVPHNNLAIRAHRTRKPPHQFKTTFTAITAGVWPETQARLWNTASLKSDLAKLPGTSPEQRRSLYQAKAETLAHIFHCASREQARLPKVKIHPGLKVRGGVVYSIKLGRKKLHQPVATASDSFLSYLSNDLSGGAA